MVHNGLMVIDMHTHSNISDGTDTPAQLVSAAAASGIAVVALCDHDTMDGVAAAQAAGADTGVTVVRGIEMSTQLGDDTVHLLAYGCDPGNEALAQALADVREGRQQRVPRMVAALRAAGVPITVEDVMAQAASCSTLGRPHVADALVALGVVSDRREAFDVWLNHGRPGYVGHLRIDLDRGTSLVHQAGGVCVLAHAWGRGTRSVLTPGVIAWLAEDAGLDGLEVDHNDHLRQERTMLRALAAANDLIVTGGSDYHGTGKVNHALGCHSTSQRSYQAIMALIAERGGCP